MQYSSVGIYPMHAIVRAFLPLTKICFLNKNQSFQNNVFEFVSLNWFEKAGSKS